MGRRLDERSILDDLPLHVIVKGRLSLELGQVVGFKASARQLRRVAEYLVIACGNATAARWFQ